MYIDIYMTREVAGVSASCNFSMPSEMPVDPNIIANLYHVTKELDDSFVDETERS